MTDISSHKVLFVTGIDTDAGKTYATARLARRFMDSGLSVATQKFIQTGCKDTSEDIEAHRRLTGTGPLPEDAEGITAPIILSYPASALVEKSTAILAARYDRVIIEGAGGLMVPVTDDVFTIDYISTHGLPTVLVTNGVLGSINHTVLSLEAIASRGICLAGVIYNRHFDSDAVIAEDTRGFIRRYVARHFPDAEHMEIH